MKQKTIINLFTAFSIASLPVVGNVAYDQVVTKPKEQCAEAHTINALIKRADGKPLVKIPAHC
jgi:hypothetical protein